MNMIKKNGGFTLVELIVVIAILAILAGIAVPAYSGYIKKANEAADYTALDAVKTAATFAAVELDPDHQVEITQIDFTSATANVTLTGTKMGTNGTDTTMTVSISEYCTAPTLKSGASATWTSAGWTIND